MTTAGARELPQGAEHKGPGLVTAWLHLAVLWAFAVAQPLLEVLADSPDFFVARDNTRGDILVLTLATVVVPPTVLVLVELGLSRLGSARRAVHLAFVAVLVALLLVQVLEELLGGAAALLLAVSVALAVLVTALYGRGGLVRTVLTVLSPAPVILIVWFLFISPVSELVLPQHEAGAVVAGGGSGAPVVFLVMDEFPGPSLTDRRQRIDSSRYPNLARLARGATWYRNATTAADSTTRAVPAILSGSRPHLNGLPITADYPQNLFTVLGGKYRLHVVEPITDLCPPRLCPESQASSRWRRLRALFDDLSLVSAHLMLPTDLEDGLPAVDRAFSGFRSGGRGSSQSEGSEGGDTSPTRRKIEKRVGDEEFRRSVREAQTASSDPGGSFASFVAGIRGSERPQLHFLHVLLPRGPWQYLPSGQKYPLTGNPLPGLRTTGIWGHDPYTVEQAHRRHLLQAEFADRMVGRLLKRLKQTRLYSRSLIVVVADHGVSFRPGRYPRGPTQADLADVASVPLLIKAPGQRRGRIDDSGARTIDILPTIADLLGIRLSRRADGRSLRRAGGRPHAVTLVTSRGGDVTMSLRRFGRQRGAFAESYATRYGERGSAPLWDGAGTRPPERRLVRLDTSLDAPKLFSKVNPAGEFVPAWITGRLTGGEAPSGPLAVEVGRRVVAVTHAYRDGDAYHFAALVPPSSFHRGRNPVALFAIRPAAR